MLTKIIEFDSENPELWAFGDLLPGRRVFVYPAWQKGTIIGKAKAPHWKVELDDGTRCEVAGIEPIPGPIQLSILDRLALI